MKCFHYAVVAIVSLILLSATPLSNSYESKREVRPIALCGTRQDWKAILNDSVSKPVLFNNLGTFQFLIITQSKEAQQYFNQGIRLYYGFNHREAFKAFQYASKLDPTSAMCWWGQALALGPHINMPMMDSVSSITAYDAIQRAILLGSKNQRENDIIHAQAARYDNEFSSDRSTLDEAYVQASRKLTEKYPYDADLLALAGEAIMDVHFWDYWEYDGKPKSWTPEILNRLETALTISPDHPGANHFYIHAVEASKQPDKALKSADRLQTLMPGAGHMVHMPSHIYIRTGMYSKGSISNQQAVAADENYFKTSFEEGLYSLAYYPHNYHFLWACAAFEGNFSKSMKAARDVQSKTNSTYMVVPDMSFLQHVYATPMYNYVQFGKWDEILKEQLLFPNEAYLKGVWQYAQGFAHLRKGDSQKATTLLDGLKKSQAELSSVPASAWINNPATILQVASHVLEAELHATLGKKDAAKKSFEEAMAIEKSLRYNEPADWHKPVRQSYGAYLISIQEFSLAEKMYREDLILYPENGWSLLGLNQSMNGQKKTKEAEEIKKQFDKARSNADTTITSSSF